MMSVYGPEATVSREVKDRKSQSVVRDGPETTDSHEGRGPETTVRDEGMDRKPQSVVRVRTGNHNQ